MKFWPVAISSFAQAARMRRGTSKSADDKLQGFDVDQWTASSPSCSATPTKIEYVNQSSDARIPNITTDKIGPHLPVHDGDRRARAAVAFTIPYYREGVGLMLKADGSYADHAALKATGP